MSKHRKPRGHGTTLPTVPSKKRSRALLLVVGTLVLLYASRRFMLSGWRDVWVEHLRHAPWWIRVK
jgi:hypothetical protein